VYTAAFIGNFTKVGGMEYLSCLLERGERRIPRWELYKEKFTPKIQEINFLWLEDDFIRNPQWTTDATFIFLHWTAFSAPKRDQIIDLLARCKEGTHVITFTYPIENPVYELLLSDTCDTSWGKAEFFFYEKITV
jgi:hypothetical protein